MPVLRWLLPLAFIAPPSLCSCQWAGEPADPIEAGGKFEVEPGPAGLGAGHRFLERLEGRFAIEGTIRPAGATRSSTWSGICRNWLILGGRFLMREHEAVSPIQGTMESLSLLGFDNSLGKYVETGCDTFATAIRPLGHGKLDATGDLLHLVAKQTDPESGQLIIIREVTTIISSNEHRTERFEKRPGEKERRICEIVYRRTE